MLLRAFIIVVFLLMGAAVNVAVAWACQVLSRTESVELIYSPDPRVQPPSRIATGLQRFSKRQRAEGFGRTHYWYDDNLGRFQAGWPMRSLESSTGPGWRPVGRAGRAWAYEFAKGPGTPKWLEGHPLPLYPLWVGFSFNTLFWGGALPPLILAFRIGQGFHRRRRGQCWWCGYPLGVSPVCTECGRQRRLSPPELPSEPPAADSVRKE